MVTTPPSTTNINFGLQNKNSASERISAIQSAQQRVQENAINLRNMDSSATSSLGLQNRDSADERIGSIVSLQQRVVENHGYDAKEFIKASLTNNSKIINTPVLERGSLLDIKI
ncbi:MAG: hypothetical protein JNL76_00410 [Alphaproteobacteria bacterium]|nr:hypothetical protein [Alphaproteobacteria bacterium]